MENQTPANEDDLHALSFAVKRSSRYHAKRASFFAKLNQLNSLATILLASAVMSSIMEDANLFGFPIAVIFGFLAFALASIVIVYDATGQAQKHHDLSRRFIELEKAMLKENPNYEDYTAWKKERLSIEAEDTNTLHVLNTICHNELARAEGYDDNEMATIGWFQRRLSPVMDIGADKLKKNTPQATTAPETPKAV